MNVALRHVLPCSPAEYWACVLDEDYGRTLFVGHLGFVRYDLDSQVERNGVVGRIVSAEPSHKGVPEMLVKLLPYREIGTLVRGVGEYVWHTDHVKPSSRTFGRMRVRPASGGCVREVDMQISVDIPVVGALLERRIADDAKKAWEVSVDFTTHWLRAA